MQKRDACAEFLAVRIARTQGPRVLVDVRHDESTRVWNGWPQTPFHVAEHTQPPGAVRRVREFQQTELDRIRGIDEDGQFLLEAFHLVLVTRHAGRVTNHPSTRSVMARQWP